MANQKIVLVHLNRKTGKEAFKTKSILSKIMANAPAILHNLEVAPDGDKWICGFALYEPTDEQIADVGGWLMDHGFGIPKMYVLS